MSQHASTRSTAKEWMRTFVVGAWLNRRHTRIVSSVVLGVVPAAVVIALIFAQPVTEPVVAAVFVAFVVLNALFYPAARELWFRFTQPMRDGIGRIWLGGPLLIAAFIVRIWVYLVLWLLAIPLGIIGSIYLGVTEASGRSWRVD